ncbi:MAG: hypothetical protein HW414_1727 [Dehalococcoidia bacterium]|nr:hypothetical protein [Dehalococcoidia bacterium]
MATGQPAKRREAPAKAGIQKGWYDWIPSGVYPVSPYGAGMT